MYQKLLISAGGGIVARSQQAEQSEAATILIGLGGTGISCLRVLKKEIFDRLQPDDPKSPIPTYQHIKFLAVDTDKNSLADNGMIDTLDEATEFFDISCQNITSLLKNDSVLRDDPALQWLKAPSTQPEGTGIEINTAKAGAGGIRQIGRFLLIQKSQNFVNKLAALIDAAKIGLPAGASLNIYIFTGIGGGTGAGTFLDVCYLVRHTLQQKGLDGSARICGFFFMPDVNLSNPALDRETREWIKSNGYASMKELDHCMNLESNGDEWNQAYKGFSVCTKEQPVNLAFLLSATDTAGAIQLNAYQYAMHVATDFVMEYLMKPFIPADGGKAATTSVMTMESLEANILSKIAKVDKAYGAGYKYCLIGASNGYMPLKSVTTYLASKIFAGFGNLSHQVPTRTEVDGFLKSIQMSLDDLHQQVRIGLPSVPVLDVDKKELYNDVQGITDPLVFPEILEPMRRSAEEAIPGILERNKKNMLQELIKITAGNANTASSLITRIRAALMRIAAQPDQGPYFAGAILHSDKADDVGNVLSGYQKQVEQMCQNAYGDLSLRKNDLEKALNKLQRSNWANRGSAAKEYQDALHAFFVKRAEIRGYETLRDVIKQLQTQVENLYNNFFLIFHQVMRELEQTFAENLKDLSTWNETNTYSKALLTISDLQGSLDDTVKSMRMPDLIAGFVKYMLEHEDIWNTKDGSKIAIGVSAYFLGILGDYTDRTMTDYLAIKYRTDKPKELADHVYQDILVGQCEANSKPLFWLNGTFSIDPASQIGFCSIPYGSGIIEQAAQTYHNGHSQMTIRPSYNKDRISFLVFQCGVPMFAYKGVETYQDIPPLTGAYIYEGAVGDSRDWQKLRGILPYSVIPTNSRKEEDKWRASIVDQAIEKGLFYHQTSDDAMSDYDRIELDVTEMEQQLSQIEEAMESGDIEKIKQMKDQVEKNLYPGEIKTFVRTGAKGHEDKVAKDLLIASDAKISKFKTDLDLLQKRDTALKQLAQKIEELEEKKKKAKSIQSDILLFADALCAGVVQAKNEFTFIYEQEDPDIPGFVEEVELTNIAAQPYGRHLPLYSAFLAFHELDQAKKDQIGVIIPQRIINLSREERDAFKAAAHEFIKPENIRKLNEIARMRFPEEAATITNHLKQIYKAIQISN